MQNVNFYRLVEISINWEKCFAHGSYWFSYSPCVSKFLNTDLLYFAGDIDTIFIIGQANF